MYENSWHPHTKHALTSRSIPGATPEADTTLFREFAAADGDGGDESVAAAEEADEGMICSEEYTPSNAKS
jgi:hypothetical protein